MPAMILMPLMPLMPLSTAIAGPQTQTAAATSAAPSPLVTHVNDVLAGSHIALAMVAALLFLRFYRKTTDRLFLFFAAAFGILCVNNIMFQIIGPDRDASTLIYGARLFAFGLIIYAIIDKNLARRSRPPQGS
jgi:hypothetical protein